MSLFFVIATAEIREAKVKGLGLAEVRLGHHVFIGEVVGVVTLEKGLRHPELACKLGLRWVESLQFGCFEIVIDV